MNLGPEFKLEIVRHLRRRNMTIPQLMVLTEHPEPHVRHCLYTLRGMGVVVSDQPTRRGIRAFWHLTGKPIPLESTNRKLTHPLGSGYDHRALAFAVQKMSATNSDQDAREPL